MSEPHRRPPIRHRSGGLGVEPRPPGTGRRRWPVLRALFPGLLVALARTLLAALLGLLAVAAVPVLAGWHSGVLLSGSMSPAFSAGDIVLSQPVSAPPRPGRVVAVNDPVRPGRILVHRLVDFDQHGELVTKGDANEVNDSSPVPRSDLLGVVRLRIPRIGLVAVWAHQRQYGRVALVGGAAILLGLLAVGGRRAELPDRTDVRDSTGPSGETKRPARERLPVRHARYPLSRSRRRRRRDLPVALRAGVSLGAALSLILGVVGLADGRPGALWAAFTAPTANAANTFAATAVFPPYRHAVLADSPLAFYRADEAAGATVAVDSSPHGTDGTYVIPTAGFQSPGSPAGGTGAGADTAVRFAGVGLATAGSTASLTNPNTFTSEIWFKTTSTAGGRFFGLGDSARGNSYFTDRMLRIFGNGAVEFGAGSSSIDSASGYNDGAWHLATASLGPAGMRLYLDGVLKAGDAGTTTGQNYTGYWRIGGDNSFYGGSLDEAAIYLSQLSDARVAAHYAAGLAATAPADYTAVVTADSPWALWHLDDPAATSYPGNVFDTPMADSSGQNHPGTYHDMPPVGLVAGGSGALTGSGAAGTSVRYFQSGIGYYPTAISGPAVFSLECWFRSSSTNGGELISFGSFRTGASNGYDRAIYLRDDGRLNFGIYSGGTVVVSSAAAYNDGAWHHVVGTEGAAGLVLYVDGSPVATNAAPGPTDPGVGYWRWGGDNLAGWPNRPTSDYFAGDLDEIAIYSTQLSAARVAAHYAADV